MSLLSFKGKLVKAFTAAAFASAALGIVPSPMMPEAEAAMVSTSVASSSYAYSQNVQDRASQDAVIVNPSAENIVRLRDRDLVDDTTIPFIAETVAEMNIPPGTQPSEITPAQRAHFTQTLRDKRLVAEMSADNSEQAVALGMAPWLAPYFSQEKANLGHSGAVTLEQAQVLHERISDKYFDKEVQPKLEFSSVGLAVAALAYAMDRRGRN